MYGFVGATETAHVLPIALAFFGIMVCFAAWAALMIRSQRTQARSVEAIPVFRRDQRGY
jgi:hypothetical protein